MSDDEYRQVLLDTIRLAQIQLDRLDRQIAARAPDANESSTSK